MPAPKPKRNPGQPPGGTNPNFNRNNPNPGGSGPQGQQGPTPQQKQGLATAIAKITSEVQNLEGRIKVVEAAFGNGIIPDRSVLHAIKMDVRKVEEVLGQIEGLFPNEPRIISLLDRKKELFLHLEPLYEATYPAPPNPQPSNAGAAGGGAPAGGTPSGNPPPNPPVNPAQPQATGATAAATQPAAPTPPSEPSFWEVVLGHIKWPATAIIVIIGLTVLFNKGARKETMTNGAPATARYVQDTPTQVVPQDSPRRTAGYSEESVQPALYRPQRPAPEAWSAPAPAFEWPAGNAAPPLNHLLDQVVRGRSGQIEQTIVLAPHKGVNLNYPGGWHVDIDQFQGTVHAAFEVRTQSGDPMKWLRNEQMNGELINSLWLQNEGGEVTITFHLTKL